MVLSSNWLDLQKKQQSKRKKNEQTKDTRVRKIVKQASTKKNMTQNIKVRKGSKLMDMVHFMTEEIDSAEKSKKDGKIFEFKSKTASIDSNDTGLELKSNAYSKAYIEKTKSIGKYVALDCEFVGVGPEGKESALARVSLVNYHGHIILDEFVQPQERVIDWRTWVSGIKPENMVNAITASEAQEKVASILEGKILVGHSVKHDLESLFISHPKSMIRDTAKHVPFRQEYSKGKTPSLKKLAKEILGRDFQEGQHSSVEDASVTMEIYKSRRKEFEKWTHPTNNKKSEL